MQGRMGLPESGVPQASSPQTRALVQVEYSGFLCRESGG